MNKISVLVLSLFSLQLAFAGGTGGNGGLSYVCRDENGVITKARLLDLWEPETYETWRKFGIVDEQIEEALSKLDNFFPLGKKILLKQIKIEKNRIMFVKKSLTPTTDAYPDYAPEKGCGFEQVAVHGHVDEIDELKLRINKDIYESAAFSETDRAALIVHEALYALHRQQSATTSSQTRKMVGILFSDNEFPMNLRYIFARMLISDDRIYPIHQGGTLLHIGMEMSYGERDLYGPIRKDLKKWLDNRKNQSGYCEAILAQNGKGVMSVKTDFKVPTRRQYEVSASNKKLFSNDLIDLSQEIISSVDCQLTTGAINPVMIRFFRARSWYTDAAAIGGRTTDFAYNLHSEKLLPLKLY